MDEESIESKYDRAFEQSAALNPIFPAAAKAEMAQMVEISARANEHINEILSTNQNVNVKGGFIAEEVQAIVIVEICMFVMPVTVSAKSSVTNIGFA